jgi:hypothetical protein
MPQYLSTDPNAGQPVQGKSYLSTDPNAGEAQTAVAKPARKVDRLSSPLNDITQQLFSEQGLRDMGTALNERLNPFKIIPAMIQGAQARAQLPGVEGVLQNMPITGPVMAGVDLLRGAASEIGDAAQSLVSGRPGRAVGIGASALLPTKIAPRKIGGFMAHPDTQLAGSLDRMAAAGVPIDLPTASGSVWARQAFEQAKRTAATNITGMAGRSIEATQKGLEGAGRSLITKGGGAAVDATDAGAAVLGAAHKVPKKFKAQADAGYRQARKIQDANPRDVVTGIDQAGNPIIETMPLPADLNIAKRAVRPFYEQAAGNPALVSQANSPGMAALSSVMGAKAHQPLLSTVYKGKGYSGLDELRSTLGGLKANYADPLVKSQSGKRLIGKAQSAVDDAMNQAADAVPGMRPALDTAREASAKQHTALRVLGPYAEGQPAALNPAGFYNTLVQSGDRSVASLRKVKLLAPQQIKEVGSAFLAENVLKDLQTQSFAFPSLRGAWKRQGTKWKNLVYDAPGHQQAIEDFLVTAQELGRSANASGSGYVMVNALTGLSARTQLGAMAVVKIFTSPRAVKFLTKGLKTPMAAEAASQWAFTALRIALEPDLPDRDAEERTRRAATTARP